MLDAAGNTFISQRRWNSNEGAVIISSNLPVGFVSHNTVAHLGLATKIECVCVCELPVGLY